MTNERTSTAPQATKEHSGKWHKKVKEKPNTFRAVVDWVDRHGLRVVDEFQTPLHPTARKGLKLRAGEVVELARIGNQYEVQQVLPYHYVEHVRHPQVPGLRGSPLADIGHPDMFSVRGRTYVREGETAHTEVQTWFFENTDAEAAYLSSVLMGGSELPGVQLSDTLKQRLASLGVATGNLERAAEAQKRLEDLRKALKTEADAVADHQKELQEEIARLINSRDQAKSDWENCSKKLDQAEKDLRVILDGIEEAEREQGRILDDNRKLRDDARKERERLLTEAKAQSKALIDTVKSEAEKAMDESDKVVKRTRGILQVLERQEERNLARGEILGRQTYGPKEEIPALQEALQNLRQARGTTPEQLVALHVGLKHTPFTVLAGPSGSGKTSLVLAYAQQMGIHVTTVAVQPGWTSVQDLHGYVNPLRPGEYRSTPFFEALGYQVRQSQAARLRELLRGVAAEALPGQPGTIPLDLVLLDEINLSHVEYFLADYLSAFELDSRNVAVTTPDEALKLALGDGNQPDDAHPLAWLRHLSGQLNVPRSFLVAGTANEDDTTRGFSDKFRDRSAFLHVEAPTLETTTLRRPKEVKEGKKYVPQQTWEAWLDSGATADMSRELIEFSERLRSAKLPVSVRLFQRTARMSGDARRLLEALDVPHAPRLALDLAVSLGIAHKYAQLTEGRSPEAQQKRKDLREALERLLAGRQQTTFSSLGWGLEA